MKKVSNKPKKMSTIAFVIALVIAFIFDLLNMIPIVPFGLVFFLITFVVFRFKGYSGKFVSFGSSRQAAVTVVRLLKIAAIFIEGVPVINFLPGCMMFVALSFVANRGAVREREKIKRENKDEEEQFLLLQDQQQGGYSTPY